MDEESSNHVVLWAPHILRATLQINLQQPDIAEILQNRRGDFAIPSEDTFPREVLSIEENEEVSLPTSL